MLPITTKQGLVDHVLLAKILLFSTEVFFLLDRQCRLISQSPSAAAITGYEDDILGNHITSVLHQEDSPAVDNLIRDMISGKPTAHQLTLRLLHLKGYWIWIECTFSNLLNDPKVGAVVLYFRDVTKHQHEKERQLAYSNQLKLLTSAVASAKDAVMITQFAGHAPAWKITYLNQAFVELTGYEPVKLIEKSPRCLLDTLLAKEQLPLLKEAMLKREPFEQVLQCQRKNGRVYWASCFFSPIADDSGSYTYWLSILRDITKQKELENLLYKTASLAQMGSWTYDLQTQHIYWSEITKNIYQVPSSFMPDVENVAPFLTYTDINTAILQKISTAIAKRKRFDVEIELLTAKKKKRWVRIIGEPEIISGNYVRVTGSIQNIDERKRAQLLALKTAKEKNEIFESIGDGFFAVDKKWKVLFWNSKAEAELGISKEQLLQKDLWSVFPPSAEPLSYQNYHWALKHQKVVHFETYYTTLDRWYDISAYPSANGLAIYFKNITKQHKALKKIVDSEKRYHDLFDLNPLPKWFFDKETLKFLDVNKAAIAHYGYSKEEFMSMTILDIRPKEQVEKVRKAVANALDAEQFTFQGLFTHLKKSGEQIRASIQSASTIYHGKKAKLVIVHDMTEQENYIRAIEEQNAKLMQVSWMQSHVLRAPLSKIMGLVDLAKLTDSDNGNELKNILDYIAVAATELDQAIKDVVAQTIPTNGERE